MAEAKHVPDWKRVRRDRRAAWGRRGDPGRERSQGTELRFDGTEWAAFITAIKAGEFGPQTDI